MGHQSPVVTQKAKRMKFCYDTTTPSKTKELEHVRHKLNTNFGQKMPVAVAHIIIDISDDSSA
ncbi:zinc finger BED domain-containing protein DAYSLEEPER-like [Dorcoceras hygrometricum]|uniref:Zinc finger BED domain-containing protein DAYSLEEPER-like n=1 Tax=Dorcoceras hygrometricum TaxID=472368 RepID=A0A2Z6ZYT0_9LAMI|nr:zinc finger BED domain-containing protein DAYSLEEPER-like [Dorcoceras hygrometricum]